MITKEVVRQACKSQRAALSIADCESWAPKLCLTQKRRFS